MAGYICIMFYIVYFKPALQDPFKEDTAISIMITAPIMNALVTMS
jgi:hypothetical protein